MIPAKSTEGEPENQIQDDKSDGTIVCTAMWSFLIRMPLRMFYLKLFLTCLLVTTFVNKSSM